SGARCPAYSWTRSGRLAGNRSAVSAFMAHRYCFLSGPRQLPHLLPLGPTFLPSQQKTMYSAKFSRQPGGGPTPFWFPAVLALHVVAFWGLQITIVRLTARWGVACLARAR